MAKTEIIVVGAGAAGLMAAAQGAKMKAKVTILERNFRPAQKIRISGKGRCNITNAAGLDTFIDSYYGQGKFLYRALTEFNNQDLVELLAAHGLETKTERGNRVFPISDDAHQVAEVLFRFAQKQGVNFIFNARVSQIHAENGRVCGVQSESGYFPCQKIIIATGGASYPRTGSTGDGYTLAGQLGHKIIPPYPALVGLKTKEKWVRQLSGLALKNVTLTVSAGSDKQSCFGEMEFAHFGITGPIVLTLSHYAAVWHKKKRQVTLTLDLKPALTEEKLDRRIQRDFQNLPRKLLKNGLGGLLPKSLIPPILDLSGLDPEKEINQISKQERLYLVRLLKAVPLHLEAPLPLTSAIVTGGGVDLKEVNPKTMESKLVPGLFFAGEVLDIHGVTGGFNLQAAFSTGVLAGISASKE